MDVYDFFLNVYIHGSTDGTSGICVTNQCRTTLRDEFSNADGISAVFTKRNDVRATHPECDGLAAPWLDFCNYDLDVTGDTRFATAAKDANQYYEENPQKIDDGGSGDDGLSAGAVVAIVFAVLVFVGVIVAVVRKYLC